MGLRFNRKEIWSSALLLFLGMATVIGSSNYQIGTLARMGPGYFPLMLGVILMALGLLIAFSPNLEGGPDTGDDDGDGLEVLSKSSQFKTWLLVILSVVAFVVVGKYGGLVPATFIMTTLSAMADRGNSLKTSVIAGIALTLMTVAVFHYGLQMQFPLFTWG